MSMMVSFVLSFFPRDVLDEILNLIESVSEDFPSYSHIFNMSNNCAKFEIDWVKTVGGVNYTNPFQRGRADGQTDRQTDGQG